MKYYVYSPERGKPTRQHDCFDDAVKEAEKLAIEERTYFYILSVEAIVEPCFTASVSKFEG